MRFYLVLLLFFFYNVIKAQVTPAEKAALLVFYNATDGPNWISENDTDPTNDWDFSGPVTDDWYGVDISRGHVVLLDMNPTNFTNGGNNLTGSIPEEIKDLSFLYYLDLAAENLTGNLPDGLFDLNDLQVLNLRSNELTGSIPNEISQLTNLSTLQLYDNDLSGDIPVSLTTVNNLQVIELDNNNLSGEIPIEFTDMIQLRILKLTNNLFTGYLYPEYEKLINLETFSLAGNSLTGTIPAEIGNMTSLKYLSIGRNDLNGTLPDELGNLSNLEYMDISVANISGSIPDSFGNLSKLETLYLYANELTGTIPSSLSNLTLLKNFWVFSNQLSGELSPSFSQWSLLRTFKAGNNLFTGSIPESYASFTNMTNFEVGSNNLSGELSPLFSSWNSITFLWLRNNNFSGEIPESYSNLTNLEFLDVGSNQLSGELSPSFSNWSNIEYLDIQNNQFEGTVPDFTGVLTAGESLEINDNMFQFGDFEEEFEHYDQVLHGFFYSPQAKVNEIVELSGCVGSSITLSTIVSGSANEYEWFKDGTPIAGANSADLTLDPLAISDDGVYTCNVTSTIVTGLTLERNPITLTVNDDAPMANSVDDVFGCDLDGDGYITFTLDLTEIESQTIGGQSGVMVSYFDNLGNPLTLTPNFDNTTADRQEITVRVSNPSGCYQETVFELITTPPATADILGDVRACESYILPELNVNNDYYTAPDGGGTQLQSGDNITSTQTIYIFAGEGACADQSYFTVTIDPPISVDEFEDVRACENYILPMLTAGNDYYTEADAGGTQLQPGEGITTTQTIYVHAVSGECTGQSSFTVTIDTPISADILDDVRACGSYDLPELSVNNDYYTAPDGGGTQLQSGETISATQTIYVYAVSGECTDQSSFTVTIDPPISVDELDDVTECVSYILPQISNGNYFTEAGGTGERLNSGDSINETKTIYIFNGTEFCSAESSFTVTIDLIACEDSDEAIKNKFPKFFTPNEDGANDQWKVDQDFFILEGTVSIYDRYGKLLTQFDAESGSWNGTFNGRRLPATDYWYQFNAADGSTTVTGHFTLKR